MRKATAVHVAPPTEPVVARAALHADSEDACANRFARAPAVRAPCVLPLVSACVRNRIGAGSVCNRPFVSNVTSKGMVDGCVGLTLDGPVTVGAMDSC